MDVAIHYHSWLGVGSSSSPSVLNPDFRDSHPSASSLQIDHLSSRLEHLLPLLEAFADQYGLDGVTKDEAMDGYLPLIQDTISTTLSHKIPWSAHLCLSPPPPPPAQDTILIYKSRVDRYIKAKH
ncbi:hypothetical protein OG21DRAFT_1488950 [Imleria badia]|nr:hypothetical protein OG21DRAFT_1488950 [Imleria badia]